MASTAAPSASNVAAVRAVLEVLHDEICSVLPEAENKVWHGHPVWFLDGNPVVGYSVLKSGPRLLFWRGQSFDEPGLTPEGTFKAAEARFERPEDIRRRDHKNIVKRKGRLVRLTRAAAAGSSRT